MACDNARLIAAAPSMYEALRSIMAWADKEPATPPWWREAREAVRLISDCHRVTQKAFDARLDQLLDRQGDEEPPCDDDPDGIHFVGCGCEDQDER